MMQKIIFYIKTFLSDYWEVIIFIVLLLVIINDFNKKTNNTEKNGVITVARIMRHEIAEQGATLNIEIYLKNKVFTTTATNKCYYCEGKFFFVKVLEENPTSYPILYMDKPVPDCIIENVKYYKGWNDFPTCSNYGKCFWE
jgi:hypothetical protein